MILAKNEKPQSKKKEITDPIVAIAGPNSTVW